MNRCHTCQFFQPHDPPNADGGSCRIRSTPGQFPGRRGEDWCKEHRQALDPKPSEPDYKASSTMLSVIAQTDGPGVYFRVAPESVRKRHPMHVHDLPVGLFTPFEQLTFALRQVKGRGSLTDDQLDLALGLLHGMVGVCKTTTKATLDGLREATGQGPLTPGNEND